MKKKLKPETGDRKGRGEQLVKDAEILNFGWWILNVGLAVLLRAARLRRDKEAKAEMLDFECWILDWQRMKDHFKES